MQCGGKQRLIITILREPGVSGLVINGINVSFANRLNVSCGKSSIICSNASQGHFPMNTAATMRGSKFLHIVLVAVCDREPIFCSAAMQERTHALKSPVKNLL